MKNAPSNKTFTLDHPIPMAGEEGKLHLELTVRRPTTRDIGDAILLIGGDELSKMLRSVFKDAGDGNMTTAKLIESGIVDDVIDALSTSLKPELLDGLFSLLARMCDTNVYVMNGLSPEDTAKMLGTLKDFFPQAFAPTPSTGEESSPT